MCSSSSRSWSWSWSSRLLPSSLLLVSFLLVCATVCAFAPPSPAVYRWSIGAIKLKRQERDFIRSTSGCRCRCRTCSVAVLLTVSPGGLEVDPAPQPFPSIQKKVNEIDFCMAPSDVSLSRSYLNAEAAAAAAAAPSSSSFADMSVAAAAAAAAASSSSSDSSAPTRRVVSLTRALNNASNRALRRILLSRCWPSAEALNLSLRQVLASDRGDKDGKGSGGVGEASLSGNAAVTEPVAAVAAAAAAAVGGAKCPVPRPILNIIMRRKGSEMDGGKMGVVIQAGTGTPMRSKRGRSDAEWVEEQMGAFRESYGALPGYPLADAYLECILSLATSGEESARKTDVLADGVYDESYRRFVSVLESAGAVFENIPNTDPPRTRIAPKLVDKDICLSVMDKLLMRNSNQSPISTKETKDASESDVDLENSTLDEINSDEPVQVVVTENASVETNPMRDESKGGRFKRFLFWKKGGNTDNNSAASIEVNNELGGKGEEEEEEMEEKESNESESFLDEANGLKPEDLGAVLLSAEEPSMTRQLNVLSNIVQRALLFGGDQELLVLSETLEADKPAFVQRWYPSSTPSSPNGDDTNDVGRPGVRYFDCLVQLLKTCFSQGVVTDLNPPFALTQSYANAYERLTAGLVELGSGYVRPMRTKRTIPKTAKEGVGRFAQWESSFRRNSPDTSAYPEDLVGSYEVRDEIGGKTIGVTTVTFKPEGEVEVAPPLQGLRWRLDPGPTHLDTCTFQVLGDDGAILQYRGFVDRGARLESRFSKRPIKIRGAVTFQMRDGESALMGDDYKRDVLPVIYQTGTTRFVMTKAAEESS